MLDVMISRVVMVAQIAWRNLLASPINLVIGGLILFGTLFFVVIGALLDSLNQSMARSVIGSVAGHVQIYAASSKDELQLFGGGMGGSADVNPMTDFPKVRAALETLPDVRVVVPMGIATALVSSGNIVDTTLARLRDLSKARLGQAPTELPPAELDAAIAASKAHVRQIITVLEADQRKTLELVSEKSIDRDAAAALDRVSGDAFWDGFDADPLGSLEFLENRIAPQVSDASMLFLRYVGTDLDAFQQSFDRMEIVKGTAVPRGQRGFLFADFYYEDQLKLRNARRLDKIDDARRNQHRLIATDAELQRFVKENRSQTRDIVLQLDGVKTARAVERLRAFLPSQQEDLAALLSELFATTDENFDARYAFFKQELAPMLQLYRVRVGDTLTIKAFTRSGYVQSVNVKVYGTFSFKGLERSPLAGSANLIDLMSFRDLYGYLTADRAEELAAIQKETNARPVTRENAEAELFGGNEAVVTETESASIDPDRQLSGVSRKAREEDLLQRVYSQEEIDRGVVLNAAVMLKDGSRVAQAIADINRLSESRHLGIKAVSWQQAAGNLGQIITFMRGLLFVAVFLIFLIAMIIINNAMMMATLQRTQTIGTMRAIGAQRGLVLGMVLIESVVLGFVFGGAGMAAGGGVMKLLNLRGIGAFNDVTYFLFSGPRLRPELGANNLIAAFVIILVVTVLSTLFPATIATRVSPLRAMQADE